MFLSLVAGLFAAPASVGAMASDTLQAVTLVADRGVVVSRRDSVTLSSNLDVASALSLVPGLYVGDYGFGGGTKSVSLRGLGSAHTALYIDGVRVGNVQSGQMDLGLLGFENFGLATVDYAQNSVSFMTAKPAFDACGFSGTVRLGTGSFGTWIPYGRFDIRLSDRLALSVNGSANITDGDFTLSGGGKRANNDMAQYRAGLDLFGELDRGDFHAKVFYNSADRGTPGSLSWLSDERQTDRNFFAQGSLRKHFSDVYELNLSAKGSYDYMKFKGEGYYSDYKQREFQLNSAHKFSLSEWWTASLAADIQWDGMKGSVYDRSRLGTVVAASTAFTFERLKADFAIEYGGTFDSDGGESWNVFSPSADLRYSLLEGFDVVAFGRRSYRTPTFNELYYPGFGNADLKAEDAWLADLGADFHKKYDSWTFKARVDGYFNSLKNKIVSAPTDDPYIWMPFNIGKVRAYGADVLAGFDYAAEGLEAGFSARYGFQEALDRTKGSISFNRQIPYVARQTVVLTAYGSYRGWSADTAFNLRSGRRDAYSDMPAWNTLDLTLGKSFKTVDGLGIDLKLSCRNLFDRRYDVISGYPMPGRSVFATLQVCF